jgi:hypothetical protein
LHSAFGVDFVDGGGAGAETAVQTVVVAGSRTSPSHHVQERSLAHGSYHRLTIRDYVGNERLYLTFPLIRLIEVSSVKNSWILDKKTGSYVPKETSSRGAN